MPNQLYFYSTGLEVFIPGSSNSYIVTAVYYIDTSDVVMRSKLRKIRRSGTTIIIFHHYDLDEVLHIFKMVAIYSCIIQAPYTREIHNDIIFIYIGS